MAKKSAGILVFRRLSGIPEVLLVHPGGPFFAKKDEGAWSIPKGEFDDDEAPLAAAQREFKEELGMDITGVFIELKPVKQKSGKMVYAWAVESEIDISNFASNTFSIEWPPKSGRQKEFPEVDNAAWFTIDDAKNKINAAQSAFLIELAGKI